jgi:hypothetical protein
MYSSDQNDEQKRGRIQFHHIWCKKIIIINMAMKYITIIWIFFGPYKYYLYMWCKSNKYYYFFTLCWLYLHNYVWVLIRRSNVTCTWNVHYICVLLVCSQLYYVLRLNEPTIHKKKILYFSTATHCDYCPIRLHFNYIWSF